MAPGLNRNPPKVLWCDMNSSFATAEQQAHPLLRGHPVGVGKYLTPNGPVISPSVEAKRRGVKTAHSVRDSQLLCPDIRILKSDPPKYREMHRRMLRVFKRWSPRVMAKSIDEAAIDFEGSPALKTYAMTEIGRKIKEEIRAACGEYVTVSIGIGPNQFLAKTAAGLRKPDGLELIDHTNLRDVYAGLSLTDLCGINSRYEARLNACGIFTPLQFLDAAPEFLHRQVFGSIVGRYWHWKLRGYEQGDDYEGPERKSYGNSHSVREPSHRTEHNLAILGTLCDMAGRRMRRDGYSCRTVRILCVYADGTHFKCRKTANAPLYTTKEIFRTATLCFNGQSERKTVSKLAVQLSALEAGAHEQLALFESGQARERRAMEAADRINARYGAQKIYLAPLHRASGLIDDSISFGSLGDMQELYEGKDAFEAWPCDFPDESQRGNENRIAPSERP